MRIVVTGAAGFIGSHVADAFIRAGHQVVGIDDLSTGAIQNVRQGMDFLKADVADRHAIEPVFRTFKPEAVSHHAAQVSVPRSFRGLKLDLQRNAASTAIVSSLSARYGTRIFIYASSGGAIYGNSTRARSRETHRPRPMSPYAVSKLAGEHYVSVFSQGTSLSYWILRYSNVYGPRQSSIGEAGVVATFARQALDGKPCLIHGDGHQVRDFVYVEDVARANVLALRAVGRETVNISSGTGATVLNLVSELERVLGRPIVTRRAPARNGDVRRSILDPDLATARLGWRSEHGLRDGLQHTIDWLRSSTEER